MSVNSLPWLGIGQRKGMYDASRAVFGVDPADLTAGPERLSGGPAACAGTVSGGGDTPPETATSRFRWMRGQQLLTLRILRSEV